MTMRSTSTYSVGHVVVVEVPFSHGSGFKRRPALVVSTERFHRDLTDVIVCPVTSQPRHFKNPGPGDRPLRGWRSAGLRFPSTARVAKILAVDKQLIGRVLGTVTGRDLARVQRGLRTAFGL